METNEPCFIIIIISAGRKVKPHTFNLSLKNQGQSREKRRVMKYGFINFPEEQFTTAQCSAAQKSGKKSSPVVSQVRISVTGTDITQTQR